MSVSSFAEVTLILVAWAVFLAPQNKLAVHMLGSMGLVPGGSWGHRGSVFLLLHMFVYTIGFAKVTIPLWAAGLSHPLSALLDLVHFIQAGTLQSGGLLAVHTHSFLG